MQRVDGRPLPAPTALVLQASAEGAPRPRALPVQFAPSQFTDMDDRAKLSSSGYVTLDGGFEDQPTQLTHGKAVQTRDSSRPEITVFGDSLRVPAFRGALTFEQNMSARQGAPELPPLLMATPLDPAEARITSRLDPAATATGLVAQDGGLGLTPLGAVAQVGVAEVVLGSLVGAGAVTPDAIVGRAWEASYG
jgi:hypothetical protein